MSRTWLITGANGFIGGRLATRLLARGERVRTLTRGDWSGLPAVPVEDRFYGDVPQRIPLAALTGTEVVVHCAAALGADARQAEAVNVQGTCRLAELAAQQGVRAFIFLSSQSARPEAAAPYGQSKYRAELELQKLTGLKVIILRPGLVVGPGSRGLFARMCRMVDRLPVLPLLDGGRQWVQPVHVDDLCEAILQAADAPAGRYCLGDPDGLTLAELLRQLSAARLGRVKPCLPIPLGPLLALVTVTEKLGLPLPVNSNNLRGLRAVERMETAADWARLGVQPRSLTQMWEKPAAAAAAPDLPLTQRAVRVLLIGGGRIGLVHALTLSRLRGVELAGVADPKPGALRLLQGLGLTMATYPSLDAAAAARPDAAVIATPAATHLNLARACLERGWGVLIEKPLTLQREQLPAFRELAAEFAGRPIGVGYVMLRNPQVATWLERLRRGQLGRVRGFWGLTLHAYILRPEPGRWETRKAIAGGGVLSNSGGHVLSMIQAAFGAPHTVAAQQHSLHSVEVEDSMLIRYDYDGFSGWQCASWSIPGYQRQENRLVITTEAGELILSASAALFQPPDGPPEICHQLDFDPGFNLAPDYAGAGFTQELADLRDAVRRGTPPPVGVPEAVAIEELMFRVYASAQTVSRFTGPARDTARPPVTPASGLILDARELSPAAVAEAAGRWPEIEVTTAQWPAVPRGVKARVTVPDFLRQSRQLMAGQYGAVLREMGVAGAWSAAWTALPAAARARGVSFWVAAQGLLAADLAALPAEFAGTILLHGYLADMALAVRRPDLLERLLRLCRQRRPRARVGFHTNLAAEADAVLPALGTVVDEVSVLASPRAWGLPACVASLGRQVGRVTTEVGPAPARVHEWAAQMPAAWGHGAAAVLVGPVADAGLAARLRAEREAAWRLAFPGLEFVEAAL